MSDNYGISDDDIADLFGGDEELVERQDPVSSRDTKNGGGVFKKILIGLAIVLVIATGIAIVNKMPSQQQQPQQDASAEKEDVELQLVNLEQVQWADRTCAAISANQSLTTAFPRPDEQEWPGQIRKRMMGNLDENRDSLRNFANSLRQIPQESHKYAQESTQNVTVVDNFKKTGDTFDPKVIENTESLALAVERYADSLNDMSTSLGELSSYDVYGIRNKMDRIWGSFSGMEKDFSSSLEKSITEKSFDNARTIQAVSQLESCNSMEFITPEAVKEKYGKELTVQQEISDEESAKRCKAFESQKSNLGASPDVISRNAEACGKLLATYDSNGDTNNKYNVIVSGDRAEVNFESKLNQEDSSGSSESIETTSNIGS